jgi:hypothetical protein
LHHGETHDFEFVPTTTGVLRFTVSSAVAVVLVSMPIEFGS